MCTHLLAGAFATLIAVLPCVVTAQTAADIRNLGAAALGEDQPEALSETFPDPLSLWLSNWLYAHTGAENYYTAQGDCDPDFRGNNPDGLWISDDRGCGNLLAESPVRLDFESGIGDDATTFSLDQFTCVSDVTFNVYDKDGNLDASVALPNSCFGYESYRFSLRNGISAIEWSYTGAQVEGNTSIDNLVLEGGDVPELPRACDLNEDGIYSAADAQFYSTYCRNQGELPPFCDLDGDADFTPIDLRVYGRFCTGF